MLCKWEMDDRLVVFEGLCSKIFWWWGLILAGRCHETHVAEPNDLRHRRETVNYHV